MIDLAQAWIEGKNETGLNMIDSDTTLDNTINRVSPYEIHPEDLDKRCSAMVDLLHNKKSNHRYNVNQAIALCNLFDRKKRFDLSQVIKKEL